MGYTTHQLLSKVIIGVRITPDGLERVKYECDCKGQYLFGSWHNENLAIFGTKGELNNFPFSREFTDSYSYDEIDILPEDDEYSEFIIGIDLYYGAEADSARAQFVSSSRMNCDSFITKCTIAQERLIEIMGNRYSERVEVINMCLNSTYKED